MGAGRPGSEPGPPPGGELAAGGGGSRRVRPQPCAAGSQPPAPPLSAVPVAGNRGAATRLKAATCCIWAATAATGPRPGPCAAASRAAWCCRIFGREEGRVCRTQQRAAAPAPDLGRGPQARVRPCPLRPGTYRGGVGSARPQRQRGRVEGAQLAGHLLHPPQRALPVGVRQFDHEAGRGALGRAGEAAVTSPDPSPGPRPSALPIRPFAGAPIARGEKPVPTPLASPWAPGARPHRHGPAAMQTLDSCLSFPLTPELHKGTAWGRIEGLGGSGHRGQRVMRPRMRQEIPGSAQVTFTGAIRAPQDGALLDMAKWLEQAPDVLLTLLLPQHPHKQLSVLWGQIQE